MLSAFINQDVFIQQSDQVLDKVFKPFANRKGRFQPSTPAKCTLSKDKALKSLKIQNFFIRPGNQISAYKTMLWVFVVRTLAWCSHILEMWSIHTGEQRQQINNRTTAKIQTTNIALHLTERPLTTVVTLRMLSLEAARSFYSLRMILDQRFLEIIRTRSSLAGFRGSSGCGPPSI